MAPGDAPSLLGAVVAASARLTARWIAAGFVHGVLNTDNLNVTGESFDYGPWRFLPHYEPGFTAAYFDQFGLYAFARQPDAMAALRVDCHDWQQANALPGLLEQLQAEALAHCPTGQWLRRRAHIDALLDNADLAGCVTALLAQGEGDDPLLREAATRLAGACPLSLALCWQQLHRARGMSLADCLRMEYTLSQNCCRFGEFAEGVRARLLDKDQQPHWRWPTLQDVPDSVLASHFQPCWSGAHPLADLQDQP